MTDRAACTDLTRMMEINFKERLEKIQNIIEMWCLRKIIKSKYTINANNDIPMHSNSHSNMGC